MKMPVLGHFCEVCLVAIQFKKHGDNMQEVDKSGRQLPPPFGAVYGPALKPIEGQNMQYAFC